MGDRDNTNVTFGTLGLGEDDAAKAMRLPGTSQRHEDGGKSFEMNAQLQRNMRTMGVNFLVLSSHFDLRDYRSERNERDAFGSLEGYAGRAHVADIGNRFSLLSYAQADLRYSDTRLTPYAQNFVHNNLTGGRDMRPIFAESRVPNDINAGLSGLAEVRREGLRLAGLEVKPSAFAALSGGTNNLEAAAGARVAVGRGVDGTARPMPTANPEAPGAMFVRNPQEFRGGNWSLGASYTQYGIADNRYLRAGEPEARTPNRAAVEAAYNISSRVSVTASYENYDNPVARLPRLGDQGPDRQGTFKVGGTFRF